MISGTGGGRAGNERDRRRAKQVFPEPEVSGVGFPAPEVSGAGVSGTGGQWSRRFRYWRCAKQGFPDPEVSRTGVPGIGGERGRFFRNRR